MMSHCMPKEGVMACEIMDIMTYMFDEENNKRLFGLEQWKLGEKKGIEKGKNDEKSKRL